MQAEVRCFLIGSLSLYNMPRLSTRK